MNVLLDNPIANMYGPKFLVFYGIVIAITMFTCGKLVEDRTKNTTLPLIPTEPDPYPIAYLSSGASGVAQVAVFNLIQLGYLQIQEKSIVQTSNHPPESELQPLENQIFLICSTQPLLTNFLSLITRQVEEYSHIYQQQLHEDNLLYKDNWQIANTIVVYLGEAIILSLGLYKLIIALSRGYTNVGYLIIMAIVSMIILYGFLNNKRSRLSYRGTFYLQELKNTFSQLQQKIQQTGNDNPSPLDYQLVVALFGISALVGSSYESLKAAFFPETTYSRVTSSSSHSQSQRRSSRSTSSNSSSCSSSSSCGSSCSSSSCGSSCGGGGCGGCGGCGGG